MTNEKNPFSLSLEELIAQFRLEQIYKSTDISQIEVTTAEVNRPGMQIVGFFDYFEPSRIQILGKVEQSYIEEFSHEKRLSCFDKLFETKIPMLVITRGMEAFPELLESAEKNDVTICRTPMRTSDFMSALISYLNVHLAPRITRHGVLVEVYGEGILILGESGVGKSECAIELVKRGHRFIADDAVEIKKVSDKTLVGSAPEIIQYFIELRGIGIVDISRLFGMGSVKPTQGIDMVIKFEPWEQGRNYDRLGIDEEKMDILGIKVPSLTIPVRPGRNLAVIVETAAMNNRQKKMGFNAAEEMERRLNAKISEGLGK